MNARPMKNGVSMNNDKIRNYPHHRRRYTFSLRFNLSSTNRDCQFQVVISSNPTDLSGGGSQIRNPLVCFSYSLWIISRHKTALSRTKYRAILSADSIITAEKPRIAHQMFGISIIIISSEHHKVTALITII